MLKALEKFGQLSVWYVIDFQKLIGSVNKNFEFLEISQQSQLSKARLTEVKKEFSNIIENLKKNDADSRKVVSDYLLQSLSKQFTEIGEATSKIPANRFIEKADSKKIRILKNKISASPELLSDKLNLIYEAAIIDFSLVLLRYRLQRIVDESFKEIHHTIDEDILKKLSKVDRYISNYQKELAKSTSADFNLPDGSLKLPEKRELQLQIDKVTDTVYRNIKSVVSKLPQKTELLSYESLNELSNNIFEEMDTVTISTFQLIDYYIQNNLLEPYLSITGAIPEKLENAIVNIKDAVRRISFGEDRRDLLGAEIDKQFDKEVFKSFIQEQHKIVKQELLTINEILEESKLNLNKQIQLTTEDLSIYRLLKSPEKYKRYVRSELDKKTSYLQKAKQNFYTNFQSFKAHIWYKQSDALLFARKMNESENETPSLVNSVLNIKEQFLPNSGVIEKLPFYYEQLFLKKYNYQSEFWFGRENEIEEATKALARYYNGYHGAILIKGARNSGKTFFANFISSDIYMGPKIYYINNLPAGSCKTDDFIKSLQEATGIEGDADSIFNKLQKDSFIIIDNLELWWEKSENGNEVFNFISKLIADFSSKFIFLITVNTESYTSIKQMVDLDQYFINTIELRPFNSTLLQKIIMFRHLSSGFNLKFIDKPDHKVNNSDLAKLFSKHFTVSEGNIGAALLSWISNIVDVKEKVIIVKMPKVPDFSIFQKFSPEIRLYLTQFILHKRLDIDKLQRVTLDSKEDVEEKIAFLKRTGIIFEIAGGIYELDKYLYIHLKNKLFNLS